MQRKMSDIKLTTDPTSIILGCIYASLGIFGFTSNTINIIGYVSNKKIHNINNKFITVLSLSDACSCIVSVYISMYYFLDGFEQMTGLVACNIQGVLYGE